MDQQHLKHDGKKDSKDGDESTPGPEAGDYTLPADLQIPDGSDAVPNKQQ